jgi:Uma2 family endonuclease
MRAFDARCTLSMMLRRNSSADIAHAPGPEPTHMAMPQTIRWTRADLDRLPDDGNRYEVVDGELFVTPPPSEIHEAIAAWLSARLTVYVATHRLGVVHHPRAVMISHDSIVEPDLMVRPFQETFSGWQHAPHPILVVEIVSSATRRRDLVQKRDFYAAAMIPEYWIVDRVSRSVIRYSSGVATTETSILIWLPDSANDSLEIDLHQLWSETQDREQHT